MVGSIDETQDQRSVPKIWRSSFVEAIACFRSGDYRVTPRIPYVMPVSEESMVQIAEYIADYGDTLARLPDETWQRSVCLWTGSHWDVFIDLWTEEQGHSDMVLFARVFKEADGYEIYLESVYVP